MNETMDAIIETLGLQRVDIIVEIKPAGWLPDMDGCLTVLPNNRYAIIVASNNPVCTLAHELYHVFQHVNGRAFDECDANMFAWLGRIGTRD